MVCRAATIEGLGDPNVQESKLIIHELGILMWLNSLVVQIVFFKKNHTVIAADSSLYCLVLASYINYF